jgi:hypothetical protein
MESAHRHRQQIGIVVGIVAIVIALALATLAYQ